MFVYVQNCGMKTLKYGSDQSLYKDEFTQAWKLYESVKLNTVYDYKKIFTKY